MERDIATENFRIISCSLNWLWVSESKHMLKEIPIIFRFIKTECKDNHKKILISISVKEAMTKFLNFIWKSALIYYSIK